MASNVDQQKNTDRCSIRGIRFHYIVLKQGLQMTKNLNLVAVYTSRQLLCPHMQRLI